MLLDHRTYTCRPGTLAKHLKIYEEYGYKPQTRHLGQPLAYLTAETGDLNVYVHIWVYKDAADRAAKRAKMAADPEWHEYLRRTEEAGYLMSQKNTLMQPVGFVPEPAVKPL